MSQTKREVEFQKEVFELTTLLGSPENFNLFLGGFKPYIELREQVPYSEVKKEINNMCKLCFCQ